ncbi:MAG: hypothetical protein HQ478_14710 [Chloroflexi bacterium]|nr:hypothetical protein [Chloroflexota bacterium]
MDSSHSLLGRRILLWGGGGKTTLSRALGENLGYPVIELDALYWLPNWKERDPVEFKALVTRTLDESGASWIADGQYLSHLGQSVLERADTVIWLELPWRSVFWRIFKRSIARSRDRNFICGENIETWRHNFLSRESIIWWYITLRLSRAWSRRLARRQQYLDDYGQHVTQIHIRSASELDKFYAEHNLKRPVN